MATELAKKLEMDHLKDTADLVSELETEVEGKSPEKRTDPKNNSKYTFDFKWEDGTGKVLSGKFTSKILTIGEQSLVGILRARLSAGIAYEALDDFTKELNFLVANLTYSLEERPRWAEDLRKLDNIEILQALYVEVAAHEATFRGQRTEKRGSEEGS